MDECHCVTKQFYRNKLSGVCKFEKRKGVLEWSAYY